jgi:monoamine oxidase
MSATEAQVIVVGAGISGLSAAKWLKEAGVNVIVLEARDRVGGRTLTKEDPQYGPVDLGGAYVGPSQNYLLRTIKELGIKTYKVNEEQSLVFLDRGNRVFFEKNTMPRFWNPIINMELNNIFYLMDKMGEEIPTEAPWKAPHAEEWDRTSFKEFMDKHLYTETGKQILHSFINVNVTSTAEESSLLWFLWYIRQCGGIKRIFSTTNGGQERKFYGGSQQISKKLAAILGDRVHLNKPVVGVEQDNKGVVITTLDGSKYKAENIILALPPMLHMKIHFTPELPVLRNQMVQRTPMGSVIKCTTYYKNAFWRAKGMCGSVLFIGEYPMIYTLDDTKPDGSIPAIIGFIAADKARTLCLKTKEERLKLIARSFYDAFQDKEALNPIHYEEKNWMEEQYSGGGYTHCCPPGYITNYGKKIREPVGRIYMAGTETAVQWSGYLDGGISAGERAAREILHSMGKIKQSEIWRLEPQDKDIFPLPFHTTLYERFLPSVPQFLSLLTASAVAVAGVLAMNF